MEEAKVVDAQTIEPPVQPQGPTRLQAIEAEYQMLAAAVGHKTYLLDIIQDEIEELKVKMKNLQVQSFALKGGVQ